MFVDYKLFLILILSLVLLYTYNRVESLKLDFKKIQNKLDKNNDCLDDKCKFNKNNDIENEINKFKELLDNTTNLDENQIPKSNLDENLEENNIQNKLEEKLSFDDKDLNILDEDINILQEKNTTEFSATDNDLNDEYSNESSDNIIIYSNSQSDKKKDKKLANNLDKNENVENLIDKIQDKPIVINLENNENEAFDLDKDTILDIDYEIKSEKNIDECFDKDEESKCKSENNFYKNNISPEINIENLKDISSYKLKELQNLAEKKNINITSESNGKKKNKTKKELYTEINNIN